MRNLKRRNLIYLILDRKIWGGPNPIFHNKIYYQLNRPWSEIEYYVEPW